MTVQALARAMDISVGRLYFLIFFPENWLDSFDTDHVYDCLIHIKNGDQYSSDNQGLWSCRGITTHFEKKFILEIDDFNVIVEVVHLCGGKHRLIPSPFANEKKKPVTNVVKFVRTYVFFSRKDE